MTSRAIPEDGPPNVQVPLGKIVTTSGELPRFYQEALDQTRSGANAGVIHFAGGPVDASSFVQSHNGPMPTTTRNAKLCAPVEQYPGEAERMIDTWTQLAVAAVQRARDATTGPRLVSELEEAQHAISEALRWSKP